ncbi:electron transfer flavoprotein subunit alpha [Atopobiaceae bacterium 24-176]
MSGLRVDADLCVGCGRCVRVCANDGIAVTGRLARVLPGCVACGLCADACPVGALKVEREAKGVDLSQWSGVLVVAQTDAAGTPLPVASELVGVGRALADARGCGLRALVLAPGAHGCACTGGFAGLGADGADEVLVSRSPRHGACDCAAMAATVAAAAEATKPETVLFGATDLGRELAPRVAQRLGCGLTADCTGLAVDPETGLLLQTRPAFGGNLMATIVSPEARPQMATVRPGVFAAPERDWDRVCTVYEMEPAPCAVASPEVLSEEPAGDGASIAACDVLVVVGRGIRDKKSIAVARRLADALGAGLGCTRPVVEAGWLDHGCQVGQTGVSVAPRLLVSLGVSGAVQHLAGMAGAECVVAVNEDPEAPIFSAADYAVVGDCREVAQAWAETLENR